jgi:hypothetical protein
MVDYRTHSKVNGNYQANLAPSSDVVHKGMERYGPENKYGWLSHHVLPFTL